MTLQLPFDCLNEIFEYLEEDKISLRSCLLVNRLWCRISVRILWRNVWNFQYNVCYCPYRPHVPLAIISTLISCLPNESKDLLNKSGISTPNSKPPLFNYASFSKVLSINKFNEMIQYFLENQQFVFSLSLDYNKHLIEQEIIKMFMSQIFSLKTLYYYKDNLHFTYFPGARNCLENLSELCCGSDVDSHFFYQLSQICNNLQSLTIEIRNSISDGLGDFIFVQNNLKCLSLLYSGRRKRRTNRNINIVPGLTNLFNKLKFNNVKTKSFYTNLQHLTLTSCKEELQYIIFPNLQTLTIRSRRPRDEILIKFFEHNGRNLKELNIDSIKSSLGSSIIQFCPNLKKISSILMDNNGLETLKIIFNNCQHLESIEIWYYNNNDNDDDDYNNLDQSNNEKEMFKIITKHSQKSFFELKIYYREISSSLNLIPEDLEDFFSNWKNRMTINLIIIKDRSKRFNLNGENKTFNVNDEIMKVIEKYKKLDIIKKFGVEFR